MREKSSSNNVIVEIIDFNGDGKRDKYAYKKNGTDGFWVALNNGSGFDSATNWGTNITIIRSYCLYTGRISWIWYRG